MQTIKIHACNKFLYEKYIFFGRELVQTNEQFYAFNFSNFNYLHCYLYGNNDSFCSMDFVFNSEFKLPSIL